MSWPSARTKWWSISLQVRRHDSRRPILTRGLAQLKVGDRLQVYLENVKTRRELVLSKEKADKMKIWEELEKLHKEKKALREIILASRRHDGDIGVKASCLARDRPAPVRDLDGLWGDLPPRSSRSSSPGHVVVSRGCCCKRSRRRRQTTWHVKGRPLDSGHGQNTLTTELLSTWRDRRLLHITDMSWGRVGQSSELFHQRQGWK